MTTSPILDQLYATRERLLAESGGTVSGLPDRLRAAQAASKCALYKPSNPARQTQPDPTISWQSLRHLRYAGQQQVRAQLSGKDSHSSTPATSTKGFTAMSQVDSETESSLSDDDVQAVDRLGKIHARLCEELSRVIVGQRETVDQLLVCLFARRHALLMGVPGLAKTLLVSKLAETLSLKFSRIQFTPDLMPMDITGTDILQDSGDGRRTFEFAQGPLFANIILADEINRAPPKTQAAMLEAMQEQRITVVGKGFDLSPPFMVLATQNPVEQEGTYPLPEAQLDRFMSLIELDYPSEAEEIAIARSTTGSELPRLEKLMTAPDIIAHQELVRRIPVPDHIYTDAARLVRKTRPAGETAPEWLLPLVSWGAGPRAVQDLILGAKSRAALEGSYMVRSEDVRFVAPPVLTHRLITTFAAQAEGVTARDIVARLLQEE